IYRHGLRNALLPVVTGLGLSILSTLSGSVAIEFIFGRPGIGSMLITGIETRDYPVIQAGIVVFAMFVVVVNLVMDVLYVFIDPRVGAARCPRPRKHWRPRRGVPWRRLPSASRATASRCSFLSC